MQAGKKPRRLDYEVTPAPDSKLAEISNMTNITETSHGNITTKLVDILGQCSPTKSILKTPTAKGKKKDVTFKENLMHSDNITSTPKDKSKQVLRARKSLGFEESLTILTPDPRLDFESTGMDLINSKLSDMPSDPIIELASGSIDSIDGKKWWKKDLHLRLTDRDILSHKGEWLNDAIINAASSVLRKQFPDIEGLQNCLPIPKKCKKTKAWMLHEQHKFKYMESGVQIHYNGSNHWFTSIKLPAKNVIHILDSAGFTKLNSSTEIQLTTLYLKPVQNFEVIFCNVQPQFSGECGVHAIANAVEYCFSQFIGMSDVQFDREKLRSHCLMCLESVKFSPFPKKGRGRSKLTDKKVKGITLIAHCSCRMPDFLEDIVQCENSKCGWWFHFSCSDYHFEESGGKSWFCTHCRYLENTVTV